MRALGGAIVLLTLLRSPVSAAPALDRHDWEQFLQPATASLEVVRRWLGHAPTLDTDGPSGQHYLILDRAPYEGSVDVYTRASGEIEGVNFYLLEGPLYLDSQVQRAAKLKTSWTLADVEKWYGAPKARTTSKRNGTETLEYDFQGDVMRRLYFTSLPRSPYLYRVVVERGAE